MTNFGPATWIAYPCQTFYNALNSVSTDQQEESLNV